MRCLIYAVPVLLYVSVFLFFYALNELFYPINVSVGATASASKQKTFKHLYKLAQACTSLYKL